MADVKGKYQKLPPGWDCKFDQATGNCYYINYFTKAMQLEDPRSRYKQLQNERCSNESIAMQPVAHGSPYHVYPSNNLPAMRAFQAGTGTNTILHNMSSSPLLSSRGNLDMSPLRLPNTSLTQTPRLGNMSRRSTIQETSFTNPVVTDAIVNKIQNMFPTASEDHIRLLLKKYYNREAVVISALQVEKHPVTMPGPYVTPPAQRHLYHSNSAFQITPPARRLDMGIAMRGLNGSIAAAGCSSRTASPIPGGRFGSITSVHSGGGAGVGAGGGGGVGGYGIGNASGGGSGGGGYMAAAAAAAMPFHQGSPRFEQWRSSPKPHSSPKMKLRYMKTIFPKADEMLLLDILASSDNNVQTSSEKLISMGYTKRDFIPPRTTQRNDAEAAVQASKATKKPGDETIIPLRPKEYTTEEKAAIQAHLSEQYPQIAERIILMALESVNYAEDRAMQILHIVQEEDELQAKKLALNLAKCVSADAEVILGTGGDAHAQGDKRTTTNNDNIITVVVKTPLNDDIDSRHKAFSKDITSTAQIKQSSSSTSSSSKSKSSNSKSSSSSSSQSSTMPPQTASSTKINTNRNAGKKLAFPSINLITPTTFTTQVILSNSPTAIGEGNEHVLATAAQPIPPPNLSSSPPSCAQKLQEHHTSRDAPQSSASPSASPAFDSPPKYQTITTKSILDRCNMYDSSSSAIHGYRYLLHGANYQNNNKNSAAKTITASIASSASSILEKLKLTRLRHEKTTEQNAIEEMDTHTTKQRREFKSIVGRIPTMGHSAELAKGADEDLLLADYVTWNGANPGMSQGSNQKRLAQGPDANKLSERSYTAVGRNPELCKGAQKGLAKGSIYAQLAARANSSTKNIKCN